MKLSTKLLIIVLSFFGLIVGLVLSAYIFRAPLFHFASVRYFASKDIKIDFVTKELSLSRLSLKDIRLEQNTHISELELLYDLNEPGLKKLTSAKLTTEILDVSEVQKVSARFKSEPNSEPTNFASLSADCNQLKASAIYAEVKKIKYNNTELPIEMTLKHPSDTESFNFAARANADRESKSQYFSAEEFSFETDIEIVCGPTAIDLKIPKMSLAAKALVIPNPPTRLKKADFSIRNTTLSLKQDNHVEASLEPAIDVSGQLMGKNLILATQGLEFKAAVPLDDFKQAKIELKGKKLRLTSPYNITSSDFNVSLAGPKGELKNSGDFSLNGFKYVDETGDTLIQGAASRGSFQLKENEYNLLFSLSDAAKTLNLNNLIGTYWPETGDYKVEFTDKSSHINVSPDISKTIPMAGTYLQSGAGKILLQGHFGSQNEKLQGKLGLSGKNISLKTEYGEFKNLTLNHDLLSLPEMKSSKHQSLFAEEIVVGPSIYNVELKYEVVDKSLVNVEKLKLTYDGTDIETGAFTLKPLEPSVVGLKATVRNLDLQKLLAMALKESVTAEGKLTGTVQLQYKNKIPSLEGHLKVKKKGWIRYRPGEKPPPLMRLSDGPMDILNGYLYDFYYETLSVDIKTDDKYKMIMTLSTLGRNPAYLRGKPLKLNINLEQNLFAAIEAMMLTYDLPNRLKEHLEKAGP